MTTLSLRSTSPGQNTWELPAEWQVRVGSNLEPVSAQLATSVFCLAYEAQPGNFHMQSNPWHQAVHLLAVSRGVQQGKWFNWHEQQQQLHTANTEDQKIFFLLAIRGLLAALGNTRFCVLKHVFITSQSRKDYSNVKPLLFQGKGVPSAFPRCHGSAQDLWALSYTSCRRSSSLPPSAGAVFWLASQGYLGRSNKQDLIDVV